MDKNKNDICSLLPINACPYCGSLSFIVLESETNMIITNKFGTIIKNEPIKFLSEGMCNKCNSKFKMQNTEFNYFVPMTNIRKMFLLDYLNNKNTKENNYSLPNPMEKKK